MNGKLSSVIAVGVMSMFLVGCSKTPPKCSDEDTASLVRKIILDQFGGSEGLTEKEILENLKIELPRASSFDEKIKKYSCEAKLVAGNKYQLPITYESQLDDQNQHVVSVSGISPTDQYLLKQAFTDAIEKSRSAQNVVAPQPPQPPQPPQAAQGSEPLSIAGVWQGALEGDGGMEIKVAQTGFEVAVNVSDASGCSGFIDGLGTLSGNTMTLIKKEEDQVCTITAKFSGDTAVLNEDNCSGYHGVACGFSGTLKKVK